MAYGRVFDPSAEGYGMGRYISDDQFNKLYDSTFPTNNTSTPNLGTSNGLFGISNDTLAGIGAIAQGLSGLAGAYNSFKNYQLAQKQFNFQKGLANRNLANQAKLINNTYDSAAQVAAGMIGSKDATGNYGFTNQAVVDQYAAKAKEKHVDGSAI